MAILDPVTVGRYAYGAGFRGETLAEMIAIAFGESTYNTDAVNKSSGATGLWQILPSAHPEFAGQNLKDPAVNARAAYSVFSSAPNAGQITKNKWSAYQGLKYWAALPPAQAAAAAASAAGGLSDAAGAVSGAVGDAVGAVTDPLTAPVKVAVGIWDQLSDPRTWLRVAYAVVGIGLIWFSVEAIATKSVVNSDAGKLVIGGSKKVAKVVATKGASGA